MTLSGLVSRVLMVHCYSHLHQHYRLTSLAWSRPSTWFLTALLLDCGYYWFHRASHEVGALWAVHQVHHSSQYFNLTTALRSEDQTTPHITHLRLSILDNQCWRGWAG